MKKSRHLFAMLRVVAARQKLAPCEQLPSADGLAARQRAIEAQQLRGALHHRVPRGGCRLRYDPVRRILIAACHCFAQKTCSIHLTVSSKTQARSEQRGPAQHLRLLQQTQQRAMHVRGLCKRDVLAPVWCHRLLQQLRAGGRQAARSQVAEVVVHVQWRTQQRG